MEKFSSYRDPGTGIQPFLTPLPPAGSDAISTALLPLGFLIGTVRMTLIAVLGLLYTILIGVCALLKPVPPLYRAVAYALTAILSRLVLLLVGLWWIQVEVVTRKRVKGVKYNESWNPRAGDIIVSNWASWVELLWLAFRFNPVFLVPVARSVEVSSSQTSTPISRTPGRRTGTGSAAISTLSTRAPTIRAEILGFHELSLISMISHTGKPPLLPGSVTHLSLQEIRSKADRPIVIFPECTTSNGRGLLRFADVFQGIEVPVKKFKVFVMCVRYDPPTSLSPSVSHSIPSSTINPLIHMFKLATSLAPLNISIRLLNPTESPSSGSFLLSEVLSNEPPDVLSEVCASLVAQIGKMKRVGMGWEDKVSFLDLYRAKK
ncbi:hypothetical protein BXZ70DRAFT_918320 [Cristinia sonorae]|uniref:Phospholipid/glycerol acyltransferase domain-containing protein n=1 Tax=Cristinia sonorae TaxID=1940300 RepID=A0A8K0UW42_9AGAR|nr:hypothetical protein BXZ70DRAFT_918320 [Cristinia sonorae]